MFKKILVPLDGSELAAKILPQVVDLAKTQNVEVAMIGSGIIRPVADPLGSVLS